MKNLIKEKPRNTTEDLYKVVVAELNEDKTTLGSLKDYAAVMFYFFGEKIKRDTFPKELQRCKETMLGMLQEYWGPSAAIEFDFDVDIFTCTANDGKIIKITRPTS